MVHAQNAQLNEQQARKILGLPVEGPISKEAIDTALRRRFLEYVPHRSGRAIPDAEMLRLSERITPFFNAARERLYQYLQAPLRIAPLRIAPLRRDNRLAPGVNAWPLPSAISPDSLQSEPLAYLRPSIRIITVSRYKDDPRTPWCKLDNDAPWDCSTRYAGCSIFSPHGQHQLPDSPLWMIQAFYRSTRFRPLKRYRIAWDQTHPTSMPLAQQSRFENFRLAMQMIEAHFHAMEPNRLQPWHLQSETETDFPHMWTNQMSSFILKTINPTITTLYTSWQNGTNIGQLWSDLGALHLHLLVFKLIHATTAHRPFIWSFSSDPADFLKDPILKIEYPESRTPKLIYGLEGGPNPERCSFRDVAIHTGILEKMDNLAFHCASRGFADAAANSIWDNES